METPPLCIAGPSEEIWAAGLPGRGEQRLSQDLGFRVSGLGFRLRSFCGSLQSVYRVQESSHKVVSVLSKG